MPITLLPPHPSLPRGLAKREVGGAPPPPTPKDDALVRLNKLVPAEVIAAYPAALMLADDDALPWYPTILAALGLLAVVLVLWRDAAIYQLPKRWPQFVVRCAAFAAWAVFLGNPLAPLGVDGATVRAFGALGSFAIPFFGMFLTAQPEP